MLNAKLEAVALARIIIDIQDDTKVGNVLALVQDLEYVKASVDEEKIWSGHLPVFDHPITLPEFRKYSREELHDRQSFR